jgi:hypothetical protein
MIFILQKKCVQDTKEPDFRKNHSIFQTKMPKHHITLNLEGRRPLANSANDYHLACTCHLMTYVVEKEGRKQ